MLVRVCFFLSGAAALVLQVLWTRMLGHVFGATALAVSTTLTAFMGGLALGAWLGGRIAPRLRRPVLAFAALETAVGAYGLLVPGLLSLMPAVQRAMGTDLHLGFIGYSVLRFLVVTAFLILPTTAMGATLPILAEAVVKRTEDMAGKVGGLYAANTFGAVAGAFAAGFVLIPTFGVSTTIYLAAAIDLSVALLVWGLFRFTRGDEVLLQSRASQDADAILAELEPVEVKDVTPLSEKLALVAFAASGGAAMALEVLWTRTVGVVIGASTYAFTLILVTFLIGLSIGAAVVARRVDRISEPVLALAWVQVAVGGLAALGTLLVDRLPMWLHAAARARDVSLSSIYFTNFGIAGAVMLPATLALGAVMPLVVRVLAPRGAEHAGPVVGRAYALNTVGAIVGSFAGGFILLPVVGVQKGLSISAGVFLAAGALLALARRPPAIGVLATAVAGAALIVFAPRWNVPSWTSGLFRMYLARSVYAGGWEFSGKLAYHRDGISTTVTVETGEDGTGVSLKVNGKVDASDVGDMPTQVLSGLLPLLIAEQQDEVMLIGYGSGVTAGAILEAPVKTLDLVEIEEAVFEASNRYFAHVNHEPAKDRRFTANIDDGRNFLLTRERSFDVIISEPSNPWMSGASSLFTADFFGIARRRLRPDGIFLQWLQLYELAPENIHALLRTFHSVFPYVLVFTPNPRSNDTLLVGSARPLMLDRARVAKALADPRLGPELGRAGIEVPEDFAGLFLMGSDELPEWVGPGKLNTDDNALIEFRAPKDLLEYSVRDARLPFLEAVEGRRLERMRRYFRGYDLDTPKGKTRIADRLIRQGRLNDASTFVASARAELEADTSSIAGGATTSTDTPALLARLERIDEVIDRMEEADKEPVVVATAETKKDPVYARAAWSVAEGREREAMTEVEKIDGFEDKGPGHRFLYAYLCYRLGRDLDASWLIRKVAEDADFVAEYPSVLYYQARIHSERSEYADAVKALEAFLDLKRKRAVQR